MKRVYNDLEYLLILAACVDKFHGGWDLELERAVSCMNNYCQETTKMSPFELVYGRLPTTKEETYFPRQPGLTTTDHRSRARKMRKGAVAPTKKAQIRQLVYYNRRRSTAKPFAIGSFSFTAKPHREMVKLRSSIQSKTPYLADRSEILCRFPHQQSFSTQWALIPWAHFNKQLDELVTFLS